MIRVYILRGGFYGFDGYAVSAGMDYLASQVKTLPGVTVSVHNWSASATVASDLQKLPAGVSVALIGYSGGGWKAAEVCNTVKPRMIDLLICLDPSPPWWMDRTPIGNNVKRAICYYNKTPFFFGLGGGMLQTAGAMPKIVRRDISENHLLVQMDAEIRKQTIREVRLLAA